jgi:hypothetical protein
VYKYNLHSYPTLHAERATSDSPRYPTTPNHFYTHPQVHGKTPPTQANLPLSNSRSPRNIKSPTSSSLAKLILIDLDVGVGWDKVRLLIDHLLDLHTRCFLSKGSHPSHASSIPNMCSVFSFLNRRIFARTALLEVSTCLQISSSMSYSSLSDDLRSLLGSAAEIVVDLERMFFFGSDFAQRLSRIRGGCHPQRRYRLVPFFVADRM